MKFGILLAVLIPFAAEAASAEPVNWDATAQHDVIEILTTDPDGDARETKVWVAALDGRGFVRTNDSLWFQNLVREPDATIRIDDDAYPVRADLVRDAALRVRVDEVFAKKYPLSMWIAGLFGRTGGVNCVAFTAREP